MISVDQIAAELAAVLLVGWGGARAAQELNDLAGKDWPAMTLLAVVVLGGGGILLKIGAQIGERMATAIESNTKAQNDVASQLALLTQRETDSQRATEAKRAEIVAKLDRLTEHVQELKQ